MQIKNNARGTMGGSGQAQNMNNPSGQGTQGNLGQGFDNNQGNLGQGFDNTGIPARYYLVKVCIVAAAIIATVVILTSCRHVQHLDLGVVEVSRAWLTRLMSALLRAA